MKSFISALIVFVVYELLRRTWRMEIREPLALREAQAKKQPVILAHWHGDEIALLQFFGIYKVATIVSTSRDGQIMDYLVRWIGGATSRGSSTRGGVGALKGLFKLVQHGWSCSFAVDGPKGPIYKAKPGVFEVSKRLSLPVYSAGVSCDRCFVFPKSWNKTYIPKPFAKITVQWLGPWGPVSNDQDPKNTQLAESLECHLHEARRLASNIFAVRDHLG